MRANRERERGRVGSHLVSLADDAQQAYHRLKKEAARRRRRPAPAALAVRTRLAGEEEEEVRTLVSQGKQSFFRANRV